ncbi:hypothetical protein [Microbispora catharanthi]|uniref:Uncharacterized protein n=1 Tax=Microbispora catharanthi TaxID=1712871 RepID=A0A5N6BLX6_9ACTN|nr:hypothetical protein [Microbispora catharanthi]KAB8181474.1 hypothetical protein FH610_029150 [Microbispora catharanthi]
MDGQVPPYAVISAKSQLFAHMRHIGVRERAGKGAEAGFSAAHEVDQASPQVVFGRRHGRSAPINAIRSP